MSYKPGKMLKRKQKMMQAKLLLNRTYNSLLLQKMKLDRMHCSLSLQTMMLNRMQTMNLKIKLKMMEQISWNNKIMLNRMLLQKMKLCRMHCSLPL
jgi:hypothetical protein